MPSTEDPQQLPPGLALAWGETGKTNKVGRTPSHTVQHVVEAAVELADAGGIEAVSMPSLAKRLGLTANAIYRYVRSKDELMVLLAEAGWGPAPRLSSVPGRWRDPATAWTQAMIERCEVHPWLVDLPVRGAPMTPNLLRWTEVILEPFVGVGLTPAEAIQCALLLDIYARRIAGIRRDLGRSTAGSVQSAAVQGFLRPRLHDHGYPILAAMMAGDDYSDDIDDDGMAFGLVRILDGIEVLITTNQRKPVGAGGHPAPPRTLIPGQD